MSLPRHRGRFPRTDTDRRLGELYLGPRAQVREYGYATNNSHQQLIQCASVNPMRKPTASPLLPESMPSPTLLILALSPLDQGNAPWHVTHDVEWFHRPTLANRHRVSIVDFGSS